MIADQTLSKENIDAAGTYLKQQASDAKTTQSERNALTSEYQQKLIDYWKKNRESSFKTCEAAIETHPDRFESQSTMEPATLPPRRKKSPMKKKTDEFQTT